MLKRISGVWILLALTLLLCGCGRPVFSLNAGGPAEPVGIMESTPEPTPDAKTPAPAETPCEWAGLEMWQLYLSPFGRNDDGWLTYPDSLDGVDREAYYPGLLSQGQEIYEEGATGDLIREARYADCYDEERQQEMILICARGEDRRIDRVSVEKYAGAHGPMGIRNGMAFDEVMESLDLPIPWEGPEHEVYSAAWEHKDLEKDFLMPPDISVGRSPGRVVMIELRWPAEPYPADMELIEYMYRTHYTVWLDFNREGVLYAWGWYIGAFAE